MKSYSLRAFIYIPVAASIALFLSPVDSRAASANWSTTSTNANWFTGGNWSTGSIASGFDSTAGFDTQNITANRGVLNVSGTVGYLVFGDTAAPRDFGWTLTPNVATTLTLAGTAPRITVNDLGTAAVTMTVRLDGIAGMEKAGGGRLVLNGVNLYTGLTTVSAGTLQYGVDNAISTGAVTVNGGTLDLLARNDSVGTVTLTSGTITSSTGILTSTGTFEMQSGSASAILAGSGIALNKTTGGTVTLSGANTYTGGTTVSNGTLALSGAGRLADTGAVAVSGGTLDLGGISDEVGAVTLNSGTISNGTLTGTSYSATNSGTVSAILAGSGAVTKTGAGTVTFSAANTYTGATLVSAGTLLVSGTGSINASSSVTVNGGTLRYNSSANLTAPLIFTSGTLAGTNFAGNTLSIGTNQTISPGNSTGTLASASQTWAGGGTYEWEINDATGLAGVDGWDLLNITGDLTLTANSGSQFNINVISLSSQVAGSAANFDSLVNGAWLIADATNAISTFDAGAFNINLTQFQNAYNGVWSVALGGSGSFGGDNSQIYLTYSAIPEPSTTLLLAGALTALVIFRRRRH